MSDNIESIGKIAELTTKLIEICESSLYIIDKQFHRASLRTRMRGYIKKKAKDPDICEIPIIGEYESISKPFKEYYFQVPVQFEEKNNKKQYNNSEQFTQDLALDSSRFLLKGMGGKGKTTFMKSVFHDCFYLLKTNKIKKIPLYISLCDFNSDDDFILFIITKFQEYFPLSNTEDLINDFSSGLDKQGVIFLLDGFDEIYGDKMKALKKIQDFVNRYPNSSFLITSRETTILNSIKGFRRIKLKDFTNFRSETRPEKLSLNELGSGTIEGFIKFYTGKLYDVNFAKKIFVSLRHSQGNSLTYKDLNNPMMIFFYIWSIGSCKDNKVDDVVFYDSILEYLLTRHDKETKKIGFQRNQVSEYKNYKISQIREVLYKLSSRYLQDNTIYKTQTEIKSHLSSYVPELYDEQIYKLFRSLIETHTFLQRTDNGYKFFNENIQLFLSAKYWLSEDLNKRINYLVKELPKKDNFTSHFPIFLNTFIKNDINKQFINGIHKYIKISEFDHSYFLTIHQFFCGSLHLSLNDQKNHIIAYNNNKKNLLPSMYYNKLYRRYLFFAMEVINDNIFYFNENLKTYEIILTKNFYLKHEDVFNTFYTDFNGELISLESLCKIIYDDIQKENIKILSNKPISEEDNYNF